MANLKCFKCSSSVSSKDKECAKCGCLINDIKGQYKIHLMRKRIIVLSMIFIMCLFLISAIFTSSKSDEFETDKSKASELNAENDAVLNPSAYELNGLYDDAKWSSTRESIISDLNEDNIPFIKKNNGILALLDTYHPVLNLGAVVIYSFEENALYKVNISLIDPDEPAIPTEAVDIIVEEFNSLYGENANYIWNTSISQIEVINFEDAISITYTNPSLKADLVLK